MMPRSMKHPNLIILLLVSANLLVGLFTFRDYGLTWDEPLFYQYAKAIGYAYSIRAHLSPDFDLERAYGPSGTDHKIYGPAYLLLAREIVPFLGSLTGVDEAALWHLVNFITFQVGVVFFFFLCRRWMDPWPAGAAALLFSTQPVLWGSAFINPKDIPFLVYFLAVVTLGFNMVDRIASLSTGKSAGDERLSQEATAREEASRSRRERIRSLFQVVGLACAWSLASGLLLSVLVRNGVDRTIRWFYHAAPESLPGQVFARFAGNADRFPAEAYVHKAQAWIGRLELGLGIPISALLLMSLLVICWPRFQRGWRSLEAAWGPLPTLPRLWLTGQTWPGVLRTVYIPGLFLGLLTSIRILGPLAGLLVLAYFLLKHERRAWPGMAVYFLLAALVSLATWPYLWEAPLARFVEVLQHMSANPKVVWVLFNGVVYPSDGLPTGYLPILLLITLSEPVVLLFLAGLVLAIKRTQERILEWQSLLPVLAWFLVPFGYVLIQQPPMYDGYRHFLFILPPVFILAGLSFQAIFRLRWTAWLRGLVLLVTMIPGIAGVVWMHPYQYAYYNAFVGWTGGAFRRFETDYWLTCYKETMEQVNQSAGEKPVLYVLRQPPVARYYAAPGVTIEAFDPDIKKVPGAGDWLLLTTRTNADLDYYPEAPILTRIGRLGATFCVVKQVTGDG